MEQSPGQGDSWIRLSCRTDFADHDIEIQPVATCLRPAVLCGAGRGVHGRKRRRSRGVLFFNGKASVNFYPAPFSDKVPTFFGERLSGGSKWRTAGVRRGVGNKGEETDARKQRPEAEKGFVIAALLLYDQLA